VSESDTVLLHAAQVDYQAACVRLEAAEAQRDAARALTRPCVIFKPAIYQDGNAWCALLGANIQDGVCGFGTTPDAAMTAFDLAWHAKAKTPGQVPT
jgi:hypothetical protein